MKFSIKKLNKTKLLTTATNTNKQWWTHETQPDIHKPHSFLLKSHRSKPWFHRAKPWFRCAKPWFHRSKPWFHRSKPTPCLFLFGVHYVFINFLQLFHFVSVCDVTQGGARINKTVPCFNSAPFVRSMPLLKPMLAWPLQSWWVGGALG